MVLPRFSSGLFRAMFGITEIKNGTEIHRQVSTLSVAPGGDQWFTAALTLIGFGGWAFDVLVRI